VVSIFPILTFYIVSFYSFRFLPYPMTWKLLACILWKTYHDAFLHSVPIKSQNGIFALATNAMIDVGFVFAVSRPPSDRKRARWPLLHNT
jgi:hypothetical protein